MESIWFFSWQNHIFEDSKRCNLVARISYLTCHATKWNWLSKCPRLKGEDFDTEGIFGRGNSVFFFGRRFAWNLFGCFFFNQEKICLFEKEAVSLSCFFFWGSSVLEYTLEVQDQTKWLVFRMIHGFRIPDPTNGQSLVCLWTSWVHSLNLLLLSMYMLDLPPTQDSIVTNESVGTVGIPGCLNMVHVILVMAGDPGCKG